MKVAPAPGASSSGFRQTPVHPQVKEAIQSAAQSLTPEALSGKQVRGLLLGEYFQAGSPSLPEALNPRHLPVFAFICMNGNDSVRSPGAPPADPNTARHFYLKIGSATFGPLPFG